MIFDTHVHYNLSPLYEDWQKHWNSAKQNGVTKSLIVGAGLGSSAKAVEIAKQDKDLYAAIGKHPDVYRKAVKLRLQEGRDWREVLDDLEMDLRRLEELINFAPNDVKAIGEIGLDYFRMPQKGSKRDWMKEIQEKAFRAQIELALKHSMPIIIHVRDQAGSQEAYWDILEIIRDYRNLRFVLHCVSGPENYILQAIELGAYIGLDANLTYSGMNQQTPLSIIQKIPKDKILLETDAPYLAPEEFKGQVCEPWMISIAAKFLEDKYQISQDQCYENACRFLGIN